MTVTVHGWQVEGWSTVDCLLLPSVASVMLVEIPESGGITRHRWAAGEEAVEGVRQYVNGLGDKGFWLAIDFFDFDVNAEWAVGATRSGEAADFAAVLIQAQMLKLGERIPGGQR